MYSDRSDMRRQRRDRRSHMRQQQAPRSLLSPMAQDFVPGAPTYGAPMPPYTPSPLSQMFTASSAGPPSPLAQSHIYNTPSFGPPSPLPLSPVYNAPSVGPPSPLAQSRSYNASPVRLPRLPSPEFPFCDTVRPYYRDYWTEGDRVSHQVEQEQIEEFEQARARAKDGDRATGDGSTSTEHQGSAEAQEQQSEAGLQFGMTNQTASLPSSSSSSPLSKRKDDALESQLYCTVLTYNPVKINGLARPGAATASDNIYQPSPTRFDNTNISNPYNNNKTDTTSTRPTAAASNEDDDNNNSNDDHDDQDYPLPLPSSLVASLSLDDPATDKQPLPSLASADAEIRRWHADSLLPPSSPRKPHAMHTPNHAPGAVGDGRKKKKKNEEEEEELQAEYPRFREWCRKELERAETSRPVRPLGRKDARRDSGVQAKCVRFADEVGMDGRRREGSEGEREGVAVGGRGFDLGDRPMDGAVGQQRLDGAGRGADEASQQENKWGWVQGAPGKLVGKHLTLEEVERSMNRGIGDC